MAITRLGPNNSTNISGINLTSQVTGTLPVLNGGTAVTSAGEIGNLVLISSVTASDASNIIFDNDASGVVFDDAYKCYLFNFQRVYGATNDVKIHFITRSGASDSGGTFRQQSIYNTYNGSTSTNPASAPNSDKLYQIAGTIRNTNPEYFQANVFFYGIGENTRMAITGQCIYKNNSGYTHNEAFSSSSDTTQTINGMKFQMSSGNIYGTISLYGIKT